MLAFAFMHPSVTVTGDVLVFGELGGWGEGTADEHGSWCQPVYPCASDEETFEELTYEMALAYTSGLGLQWVRTTRSSCHFC
jgi:hypothetical protein